MPDPTTHGPSCATAEEFQDRSLAALKLKREMSKQKQQEMVR